MSLSYHPFIHFPLLSIIWTYRHFSYRGTEGIQGHGDLPGGLWGLQEGPRGLRPLHNLPLWSELIKNLKWAWTAKQNSLQEGHGGSWEIPEPYGRLQNIVPLGTSPCPWVPTLQSLWCHCGTRSWAFPLKGKWPFFMFNGGSWPTAE